MCSWGAFSPLSPRTPLLKQARRSSLHCLYLVGNQPMVPRPRGLLRGETGGLSRARAQDLGFHFSATDHVLCRTATTVWHRPPAGDTGQQPHMPVLLKKTYRMIFSGTEQENPRCPRNCLASLHPVSQTADQGNTFDAGLPQPALPKEPDKSHQGCQFESPSAGPPSAVTGFLQSISWGRPQPTSVSSRCFMIHYLRPSHKSAGSRAPRDWSPMRGPRFGSWPT